ncbi:MAG TPA: M28 family peptidase [Gemmatimonadales bacterium]|nr:M28 family peptidase [Gemmatimonadales bacterium]
MKGYRTLLEEISVSRLVGSADHARVRDLLTSELKARGFVVMEQRFPARPSPPLWGAPAAEGVSLIAVRPRARIAVWLAAHYDAKGQPLSMAARLMVAAGCAIAVVAALAGLIAGGPPIVAAPAAALAALLVGLNRVTDRSPGAVDNGAGVLTVLATVDALPPDATVGVVLLDAEEYGLLGARVLARERPHLLRDATVINFDGIDDRGRVIALIHRGGPMVDRVVGALGARRARWLPVVVDGLELARAARECVTVMRGDWQTARVVHTPRDTAARLTLAGVHEVAASVADALREAQRWRVDDTPSRV